MPLLKVKTSKLFTTLLLFTIVFNACKKDNKKEIDTEYPEIVMTANSFPIQCSTFKRGQTVTFKTLFKDNIELGAYSLDIHHNFDHHSHSTEVEECSMEPKKSPVKPFLFIENYSIPKGLKEYQASAEITIPADIDPGDYHFMIRLTDQEGWQTLKGLSIKIN